MYLVYNIVYVYSHIYIYIIYIYDYICVCTYIIYMSYNIVELIQSILVWFDKKAVRTRTMKSNGLAKLWCLPLLTCLQFWKTYQPRAQPYYGRKNKAAVRWKVDICASPHFNLPSRRRSYVLYCFVVFCSVLSLIHEIINDINGN
jgi:hypothetical protein